MKPAFAVALLGGAIAVGLILIAAVFAFNMLQLLAGDGGAFIFPYVVMGAFGLLLMMVYVAHVERERWRINISLVIAAVLFVAVAVVVTVPSFERHGMKAVVFGVIVAIFPMYPMFAIGPLLGWARVREHLRTPLALLVAMLLSCASLYHLLWLGCAVMNECL